RLVELLSTNPARILGLDKGALSVGSEADLTVVDLERPFTVDPSAFRSKGRNTPFAGWSLRGQAVATIVQGEIVARALE
ncbi:MAG: amidohydrolase family protein, partial [Acidobacteriota bacterium]